MNYSKEEGGGRTAKKATGQGWISVKDRLPEITKTVLIKVGADFVTMGRRLTSEWRYDNGNIVSSNCTHWMELPKPPKQ